MDVLEFLLMVIGGLGIFLLGMKHLSEGLQAVAGNGLRKFMGLATTHRLAGVSTGLISTVIVQSSSIITVMLVGFVSTALMTLPQAINVMIGSNIGTTATVWIIAKAPSPEMLGLGGIALGALLYFFTHRNRPHDLGLALLGLGLVFLGLFFMSKGVEPIKDNEGIKSAFAAMEVTDFWGVCKVAFFAAIFTAVVQSSAASIAIAMTLAQQGLISYEMAISSLFGANVGTTMTAWLAALSSTAEGKRVATAHTLSNVIGSLVLLPFVLPVLVPLGKSLFPNWAEETLMLDGTKHLLKIMVPIAATDTFFSVIRGILMFPFVKPFARFVTWMIPSKEKEVPRLAVLTGKMVRTPVLAVEQAEHEVIFMAESDLELLETFRDLLKSGEDREKEEHILHREDILDTIQREITDFLGQVMTVRLPQDVANHARMLLRVTDEYESVSDEVASLLKMLRRMWKNNLPLSEQGLAELLSVHDEVARFGRYVTEAQRADLISRPNLLMHMKANSVAISELIKNIRAAHLSRLENNTADPLKIVVCMDILTAYKRIKEDYVNIAETLVGGKGQ